MADLTLRSTTQGVRPHSATELEHEWRGVLTEGTFRAGRAINERPVRHHRLAWEQTDRGQYALLEDLWRRSRGGVARMNWTPLGAANDSGAYEVQFVPGSKSIQRTGYERWDMSVEIREAH